MPALPLVISYDTRTDYKTPASRMINMLAEATPSAVSSTMRLPRPGLKPLMNLGLYPCQGMFQHSGVFNADLFTVSGGQLYRASTALGPVGVPGPRGLAFMDAISDASDHELAIVSGGRLSVYDGTTLAFVPQFSGAIGPLPAFSSLTVINAQAIYTVDGSNQFYWSDPDAMGAIDALSFSTAETEPSPIVRVASLGDELCFFKQRAVEWFYSTGDLNLPYQLSQGRTYTRGCAAAGSVVKCDNALFFVGDDRTVYRTGPIPIRVSTNSIEETLQSSPYVANISAWTITLHGHPLYVMSLPDDGCYVYDVETRQWSKFAGYDPATPEGEGPWIGRVGVLSDGVMSVGSSEDGKVWTLDPTAYGDDNGTPILRIIAAARWLPEGVERCFNVVMTCVRGVGLVGDDPPQAPPLVEMRWSDDGGRTFGNWFPASLGRIGQYKVKAVWWGLGLMVTPGRLFEFRVSDPVLWTIESTQYNVARP